MVNAAIHLTLEIWELSPIGSLGALCSQDFASWLERDTVPWTCITCHETRGFGGPGDSDLPSEFWDLCWTCRTCRSSQLRLLSATRSQSGEANRIADLVFAAFEHFQHPALSTMVAGSPVLSGAASLEHFHRPAVEYFAAVSTTVARAGFEVRQHRSSVSNFGIPEPLGARGLQTLRLPCGSRLFHHRPARGLTCWCCPSGEWLH